MIFVPPDILMLSAASVPLVANTARLYGVSARFLTTRTGVAAAAITRSVVDPYSFSDTFFL
jgi:hypothetical protein